MTSSQENKLSDVETFEDIIESTPGNIYWKDAHGRFRGCNNNFLKLLGIDDKSKVIGKTDYDLFEDILARPVEKADNKVIQTGKETMLKEVGLDQNGKKSIYLSKKKPLYDRRGNIVGVLGVSIDITAQVRAEEKLAVEKEKALAASRSKSEFIACMSHDIRTPITGLLAMGQAMIDAAEEAKQALTSSDTKPTLNQLIETVQQDSHLLMGATHKLLNLCNSILAVVQLESGKTKERIESFDLRQLIENNIELLMLVALNKKLQLSCDLDPLVPAYLKGIRLYLDRILLNLLSNALKFTDKGFVKITVKLAEESRPPFKPGDSLKLNVLVEDSGIGIPSDKLDTIFEHFSRLNASYEGTYEGSGLGLYTVKRYVKVMKGSIHVASELGKGACFTLTLPFTVSEPTDSDQSSSFIKTSIDKTADTHAPVATQIPVKNQASVSSSNKGALSILIVEDNQLAAMSLKLALKSFRCVIDVAENGTKAIEMAKKGRYDFIFMDVGLPDINGIEVTKKIRRFTDTKRSQVPIVAVTGHAKNSDQGQLCFEAGMQDVLSKPAEKSEVESVLQTYVFSQKKKKSPTHQTAALTDVPTGALKVIDWETCVKFCQGDEKLTHQLLSILSQDLKTTQSVLTKTYSNQDRKAIQAELHRIRGGVSYLKLPELEHTLKAFHEAVKADRQDKATLKERYTALQKAMRNFCKICET